MQLWVMLLLLLPLLLSLAQAVVVPTKPVYRTEGDHQNSASLCAANHVRMPACAFDRDVDDVVEFYSVKRPTEPLFVWCYERTGNKCRAIRVDPSSEQLMPDLWWIDCDESSVRSLCLDVPHEAGSST